MQVEPVSEAVFPLAAFGASSGFCPAPVAHVAVAAVPNAHEFEIFFINVSLYKIRRAYGKACRDGAVAHHASDVYPAPAEKEEIPRLELVVAEVSLARIVEAD